MYVYDLCSCLSRDQQLKLRCGFEKVSIPPRDLLVSEASAWTRAFQCDVHDPTIQTSTALRRRADQTLKGWARSAYLQGRFTRTYRRINENDFQLIHADSEVLVQLQLTN
jgi:hypothetical protein